jgi:hypothetical protein
MVEPHALLGLVIPGLRMPLVYAVLSSAILLFSSPHLMHPIRPLMYIRLLHHPFSSKCMTAFHGGGEW